MKDYRIKVITEQKRERVTLSADGRLVIAVNAKRQHGAANERMLVLVALFLGVDPKAVMLLRGKTQSTKTIRVS